ncbi:MAG: hypothetical protein GWN46_11615, partial [Gammaproteobacteria bacterium]|nr:hypothetical protein [Gammaproteobacteria bacterium]
MDWIKDFINVLSLPQWSFTLSLVLFVVAMWTRFLWTKKGGLVMLVVGGLAYVLAMLDPNFRSVVAKPDNVPITMMIFIT